MQAIVEEQLSVVLPKDIFRRRLRIDETMRKSTARCLFGVPDPVETQHFVDEVYKSNIAEFERNWNFNIELGEPISSNANSNKVGENIISAVRYNWNETLEADTMAKSNLHRFDAPIAPNTRPVTLFFAPSDVTNTERLNPIAIENDTSEIEKMGGILSNKFPPGQIQQDCISPFGENKTSNVGSVSRKEIRLSPPPMKQRCITDYMRVKKPQLGRKGLR